MSVSVEAVAAEYFSSLNLLSRSILNECKAIKSKFGSGWNDLPLEKQDELLDEHFINHSLAEKYETKSSNVESLPDCFPVLRINSGEKIVVDFEHDEHGWTWRDEHSGPFSWRTKSQQDLTLDQLFSENELQPVSVKKKSTTSKTASVKSTAGGGCEAKNEVEEMFKKFGLKKSEEDKSDVADVVGASRFGPENLGFVDVEGEPGKDSSTAVISSGRSFGEKTKLLEEESKRKETSSMKQAKDETQNKGEDARGGSSKKKLVTSSKKKRADVRESGKTSRSSVNGSLDEGRKVDEDKLGNLNKVFFDHDIGESSTDSPVVILSEEGLKKSEQLTSSNLIDSSSPGVIKTGFDFLDNW